MTKENKHTLIVIGSLGAGLLILWWLLKGAAPAAGEPAASNDNQAPYYLTSNIPQPGSNVFGAPYYGPISFNSGCGCDSGQNNTTPQIVGSNTPSNAAYDSALYDPTYSYLLGVIKAE